MISAFELRIIGTSASHLAEMRSGIAQRVANGEPVEDGADLSVLDRASCGCEAGSKFWWSRLRAEYRNAREALRDRELYLSSVGNQPFGYLGILRDFVQLSWLCLRLSVWRLFAGGATIRGKRG